MEKKEIQRDRKGGKVEKRRTVKEMIRMRGNNEERGRERKREIERV